MMDYFNLTTFHEIARACSIHGDTLHYGYSMNWSTEVRGAQLMDYRSSEIREQILKGSKESIRKYMQGIKIDGRFRLPLPTNPVNTCLFALGMGKFDLWLNRWLSLGNSDGSCRVAQIDHFTFGLASMGTATTHFTWTYDPQISFNGYPTNLALSVVELFCAYCKLTPGNGKLFKCSRCRSVSYCNKTCQTEDWKMHKSICGNLK